MSVFQAILISLLGYLTYIHVPFLGGGLVGWYCIGRPLVSALFIGLILGDVKTAITLGVEIQLIFIGLVTPGGSITPDMNLATYVAIPLGVVTGLDKGATVALAVAVANIANIMAAPCYAATLIPVNYQKKLVAEGKLAAASQVPVWGNGVKFIFRFIPTFILCYFGQTAIESILAVCPAWVIELLTVFGNPMCLIGFAILMKMMIKKPTDLIYYTFGFALTSVVPGGNMVTVLVFGLVIALIEFKVGRAGKKVA